MTIFWGPGFETRFGSKAPNMENLALWSLKFPLEQNFRGQKSKCRLRLLKISLFLCIFKYLDSFGRETGSTLRKMFSFESLSCCTIIVLQICLYLGIPGVKSKMVAINAVPIHQSHY